MIEITKLTGKKFHLNALYIENIESFPDTTITLTNGHKYIVIESEEQVKKRMIDFYQTIHLMGQPEWKDEKDE
ncbi:flagellar FlbD family protein [Lederbergia sp. NSJ-179]|uniref:flagellar FlbD family protein n=1 Tax=Lederbergia sp. NSJ-179 TaxID=2931402 RepID=UPI001FD26877|nr:flagellar FlbD family protein [Lederbergia sp. NSJ-179]MCJ7839646.1 flagellar FlbD family protein [Lederbergia sp. NSJ-179]